MWVGRVRGMGFVCRDGGSSVRGDSGSESSAVFSSAGSGVTTKTSLKASLPFK
jgi:hypothetical protein